MIDEPAAVRATFSDFKLIRTRQIVQIVLEIPLEEADTALATLGGLPRPDKEAWVALARLNGVAKPEPEPQFPLTEGAVLVEGGDSYQYNNGDWVPNNPNQKGQYPLTQGRLGPKEKRKWDDLKLSMQAGIRCNERAFIKFLDTKYGAIHTNHQAEDFVRGVCEVESRSELNDNPKAASRWIDLDHSYQAWLKVAE